MDDKNKNFIENFLKNPTESLNCEMKEWAVIETLEGRAKLIKSCMALYNNNGGILVLGFDNNGRIKQRFTNEEEINSFLHFDEFQQQISKYSSEQFEANIELHKCDEALCAFIFIPAGVKRPAQVKCDLHSEIEGERKNKLLAQSKIYTRTMSASGAVSTSEPKHQQDWDKLINHCLENREADIAKFFQKHFTQNQLNFIKEYFSGAKQNPSEFIMKDLSNGCLSYGYDCFQAASKELKLPPHGSFQVAFKINSEINFKISQRLLTLLNACNPRPSGWPLWVILNNNESPKKPTMRGDRWEVMIRDSFLIDFWIITKEKCFYQYRALQDDLSGSTTHQAKLAKLAQIDYVWQTELIADSITTALAFAKALMCEPADTLSFTFQWTGLKGRQISAWAHPIYEICYSEISNDDTCKYTIDVPINTSPTSIIAYTFEVIQELFLRFGGYDEMTPDVIEKIVNSYIR